MRAADFGIPGSGTVRQVQARRCTKYGHGVSIGTRNPGKLADWSSGNGTGADRAGAIGRLRAPWFCTGMLDGSRTHAIRMLRN